MFLERKGLNVKSAAIFVETLEVTRRVHYENQRTFCSLELDVYFLEFAVFRATDFFREIGGINRFVNSL